MITLADAVAWLNSKTGLSFSDPSTRDAYVALIYPHDDPTIARGEASVQSMCAGLGMAYLRMLLASDGRSHPLLDKPYSEENGEAPSIVQQACRDLGIWTTDDVEPQPGDLVAMGGSAAFGGEWHVDNLVTELSDGEVWCVAGGQADTNGRSTAIATVQRKVTVDASGHRWFQRADGHGTNRRVCGVGQVRLLGVVDA